MHDTITIVGTVGRTPRHIVTSAGLPITTFRLASNHRRFDRAQGKFVDGETNWYSVSAFRQLAVNAAASLQKGEQVIVTGKLKVKTWQNAERSGIDVEIEADAIGHDLSYGTTRWAKTVGARGSQADDAGTEEATNPDDSFADVADPAPGAQLIPEQAAATPF